MLPPAGRDQGKIAGKMRRPRGGYRGAQSDSESAESEYYSDSSRSSSHSGGPPRRRTANGAGAAGASPAHANILTKLQGTRQYIDELVQENEAFASMVDVLRALYHWKEVVRSVAAIERAVCASATLQTIQAATRCVLNWRMITSRERRARAQEEDDQRSARRGEKVAAALSRRVCGHALMRYFREWLEAAARQRRWANDSSTMVRRARQHLLSDSFQRWWARAAAGASLQSAAHRVVQRSLHVRIQIGMKHWIRTWRMGIAYRRLILRFHGKRIATLAAAVFGEWKHCAQNDRRLRTMQERGEQVGERLTLRRSKSILSVSMSTWQWHCQEKQRMVHLAGKTIFRWQRLNLAIRLDRWRQQTQRRVHAFRVATCIIHRWRRLTLSAAFAHWSFQTTVFTQQRKLLKRSVARIQNGHLSSVFYHWNARVRLFATQRANLQRMLLRMENRATRRAFHHWGAQVDLFTKRRAIVERVLLRMENRAVQRAFNRWGSAVDRWQEQAQQHKFIARVVGKFMRRWQFLKLALMVDTWRDQTQKHKHAWRITASIFHRRQRLVCAYGFDAWKELTQCRRQRRGMEDKIARMREFLAHQVSGRAFRGWLAWSMERRRAAWCSTWFTSHRDARRLSSGFHLWLAVKDDTERRNFQDTNAQAAEGLEASRKELRLVREQLAHLENSEAKLAALSLSLQAEVTALGQEVAATMADIRDRAQQRIIRVSAELARTYKDRLDQREADHQAALTALEVSNCEAIEVARLREEERARQGAARELEQEQKYKQLLAEMAASKDKAMLQQSNVWQSQLDAALQRAAIQEQLRCEAEEAARLRAQQDADSAAQQFKSLQKEFESLQKELESVQKEEASGIEREAALTRAVQAAEDRASTLQERSACDAQMAADREQRLLEQQEALLVQLEAANTARKEAMDAMRCQSELSAVRANEDGKRLRDIQQELDLALTQAALDLRLQEATLRQQVQSDARARFMSKRALNLCRKVMCVWLWQDERAARLSVNRNRLLQHCIWTKRETHTRRCFILWGSWMQHLKTSWIFPCLRSTKRHTSARQIRHILLAWHTHGLHRSTCQNLRGALVAKLHLTSKRPLLCWCVAEWFALARTASEQCAVLVRTHRQRAASDAFDAWLSWTKQRRQFRIAVGRLVKRKERYDHHRLRNYVQDWRGISAQALRLKTAAGKIERYHTFYIARCAFIGWSESISMRQMSQRLKAIAGEQLLRDIFWQWWEETANSRHDGIKSALARAKLEARDTVSSIHPFVPDR